MAGLRGRPARELAHDRLLSPEDAADRLGVAPRTVRAWLRTGKVRGVRAGRLWRLRAEDLPGRSEALEASPPPAEAMSAPAVEAPPSADTQLREQRRRQALLADLDRSTMFTIDLPAVLAKAAAYLVQALELDYAGVFEWQPDGQTLVMRVGAHWETERAGEAAIPAEEGSYGWHVLQGRGALVVEDWSKEPRFERPAVLAEHEVASTVSEVLPGRQRPHGMMGGYAIEPRTYSLSDLSFIHSVAGIVARAVDQRRVAEERDGFERSDLAARGDAEQSRRRLRFLADAGSLLATTADYRTTIAGIARLAVPYLADWCLIEVVAETAADYAISVVHADNATERAAVDLIDRLGLRTEGGQPLHSNLSAGRGLYVPEVFGASIAAYARDDRHLEVLRLLGVTSLLSVPMVAHARILGTFVLGIDSTERQLAADDFVLAEEVAGRLAISVENALLYRAALEGRR